MASVDAAPEASPAAAAASSDYAGGTDPGLSALHGSTKGFKLAHDDRVGSGRLDAQRGPVGVVRRSWASPTSSRSG